MPPDPPSMGPITPPEPIAGPWRDNLTAATSAPECSGCHGLLNPPGFAFEHYDSVGRYRTRDEQGYAIDASGTLSATDAAGYFENAPELLRNIASSEDGQACFVSQWLELAHRGQLALEDSCVKQELARSFRASDGNVVQLMLAIAASDRFKYRLASEL